MQSVNRHIRRSWTAITQSRMQVRPTNPFLLPFLPPLASFLASACSYNPFFQPTKRPPAWPACLTLTPRLTTRSTTSRSLQPGLPDPNVQPEQHFTGQALHDRCTTTTVSATTTTATTTTTTTTLVQLHLLTLDQPAPLQQPGRHLTIDRSPSRWTSTRATTSPTSRTSPRRTR